MIKYLEGKTIKQVYTELTARLRNDKNRYRNLMEHKNKEVKSLQAKIISQNDYIAILEEQLLGFKSKQNNSGEILE
jgi:hypothetical protein